jgi:hypothetical protein
MKKILIGIAFYAGIYTALDADIFDKGASNLGVSVGTASSYGQTRVY